MRRAGHWGVGLAAIVLAGPAPEGDGDGRLRPVEVVARDDLNAVVSVALSPDGKFLYAAGWKTAAVVVFARDAQTGRLRHEQTVSDPENLPGVAGLSLSPDGRLVAASAFQTRAVVLFRRDPESGRLTRRDVARDGAGGVRLQDPIDVAFAPDGRFAYVLDDNGPGEDGRGAVVAFRVRDDKLELVGADEGRDGCYYGARGLAVHPDGKTLLVASFQAAALVSAAIDPQTGKTAVRQVVKDEQGGVHGLDGAMGVAISPDGRSAYVASGRFRGDDAVSAFRIGPEGRLDLIQEFLNDEGPLKGFEGGNHLAVSPDGRNLYAAATRSGSVACFRRNPDGTLKFLETLPDGGTGGDLGAAEVALSRDGRFAYVATEDHKAISVFRRDGAGRAGWNALVEQIHKAISVFRRDGAGRP